jgi:hypothetical protein
VCVDVRFVVALVVTHAWCQCIYAQMSSERGRGGAPRRRQSLCEDCADDE